MIIEILDHVNDDTCSHCLVIAFLLSPGWATYYALISIGIWNDKLKKKCADIQWEKNHRSIFSFVKKVCGHLSVNSLSNVAFMHISHTLAWAKTFHSTCRCVIIYTPVHIKSFTKYHQKHRGLEIDSQIIESHNDDDDNNDGDADATMMMMMLMMMKMMILTNY